MDIRIVNTCNNNCLYCLEQPYRDKEKFVDKHLIFDEIFENKIKNNIAFYWWNPLLHPDLWEIISFTKGAWYSGIWILTNTWWLDKKYLDLLVNRGLSSIWFYFHSFDRNIHNFVVNGWIDFDDFMNNIKLITDSWLFYKAIIHVNRQNIQTLYRDIYILNKKYWVKNFEFINYFPFDRPYEKFRDLLEYDYNENKVYMDKLFKIIIELWLEVYFVKFSKDFFWDAMQFYDFEKWVLWQIWDEDILRLKTDIPFCLWEGRCKHCFIKDNCRLYGK